MRRLWVICLALAAGSGAAAEVCRLAPGQPSSCVRALACIGEAGLWFDGRSIGWNEGRLEGQTSDGSLSTGRWTADGPCGMGLAELTCDSGLAAQVGYHAQDPATGTTTGTGKDNLGRAIKAWSGENVLQFLTPSGEVSARQPCTAEPIPMS